MQNAKCKMQNAKLIVLIRMVSIEKFEFFEF